MQIGQGKQILRVKLSIFSYQSFFQMFLVRKRTISLRWFKYPQHLLYDTYKRPPLIG